jgi:hypothetical protein
MYYQYHKITGEYMGNSVENIDDEYATSTTIEPPYFEQDSTTFDFITIPYFINGQWEIRNANS